MTIAAGLVCSDGILLASDTLYSGAGHPKHGQKFWVCDRSDPLVVFGGAGLEGGLRRTRDEIDARLRSGLSYLEVLDIVDDALAKVHAKLPPGLENRTSALVVIRSRGKNVLYENSGGLDVLSAVDHPSQCVGYAQALGSYFSVRLFHSSMSMRWARTVAAYLIRECKQYSEYCGGDSHLFQIPNSGPVEFINDQQAINEHEEHLAQLDEAMRVVLPGGRFEAPDFTPEHRLGELVKVIENVRNIQAAVGLSSVQATGQVGTVTPRIDSGPTEAD